MDKKYTSFGVLLIASALLLFFFQNQQFQRPKALPEKQGKPLDSRPLPAAPPEPGAIPAAMEKSVSPEGESSPPSLAERDRLISRPEIPEKSAFRPPEELFRIENDFIDVEFTSYGGAIKEVALKKYPALQGKPDPYIFNQGSEYPALGISREADNGTVEAYAPPYRLLRKEKDLIEFERELVPGIRLVRSYRLSHGATDAAPYVIDHVTRFINRTATVFKVNRLFVNVGTAPPTASDPSDFLLNFGYYDGKEFDNVNARKFRASKGVAGFFKRDALKEVQKPVKTVWAAATNQFFTSILTPELPGKGVLVLPAKLPSLKGEEPPPTGLTGNIEFDLENVKPNSERSLKMQYYVGPKEYSRLTRLEPKQDLVMQFGFFGFLGKLMLYLLQGLHRMVGNYGLAIIIMTLMIRLLLWPLTAKATQTSKKMQKLQGPLQELREKYKDNQEKLNKEMLKLWKEHGVNPFAGCLPIFIQLPIFFALFRMLRSASELRFAEFLWISDLSLPDTIGHIGGFPFNPLPLVMTVSMYYQMRMTPMNTDPAQQKIFRMMPFFFLFISYRFSSGLVLYWTISNFFSIFQQYHTNKMKDPEENLPSATRTSPGMKKKKTRKKRPR